MTTFGALLAQYRQRVIVPQRSNRWPAGPMSQTTLARQVGVDPAYINRMERDGALPSRQVVERISTTLGLDSTETARLLAAAGHWPWPDLDVDRLIMAAQTLGVEAR